MTINVKIDLPEALKSHIDDQIACGRFENVEAYLQNLVHEDQVRRAEEELEQKVLEGMNSGESIPVDKEFWKKLKSEALARHSK